MSILLFGDFAIPFWGCINIDSVKSIIDKKIVIANLEGPFVSRNAPGAFNNYKINLCSENECVDYLKQLDISYLSFANNHILDYKQTLQETISVLNHEGIDYFGTAEKPYIEFIDSGKKVCIWGTVSYVTGQTSNNYDRINAFNPIKLFYQIGQYKENNPEAYLIIFLHWGYEFAMFPQPADREWSMRAIDNGANAIIGVHPHEVQGIEKYKNGIIVYSLGNFILSPSELSVPSLSPDTSRSSSDLLHLPKIGLEINPSTNDIRVHKLFYNKENSRLMYIGETNEYEGDNLPYYNFSIEQYRQWYRRQKYKGEQRSRFNIYPTFYSYYNYFNIKFHITKLYLIVFKKIRQLLISVRLHTPTSYNELTREKRYD